MENAEGGGESAAEAVEEGPGSYSVVEAQVDIPELDAAPEEEGGEFIEEDGELASTEALEAALDGEAPEAEEEPPPPESRTLTIDGKEVEVTADEAFKRYELVQASYQRMEKAAGIQTEVKELFGSLRSAGTPQIAQFLRRLGHDPVEFATRLGADVLRRHDMSPEQREMEDFRSEKAHFQRQQQQAQQQANQDRIAAQTPIEQERIHGEYMTEMDAMSIPASPKVREGLVMRVAARQLAAMKGGYPMPARDALAMEWESLQAVAGIQAENERARRLAAAPSRQKVGAAKRTAPKKASSAPAYQTYGAGDLDGFKALLDG